jgi:hypothetical protein
MTENSMSGKKHRRFGLILLGVAGAIAAFTQCKSDTPTTPVTHPPLELLYPKGGESFKVGDTVPIKWSVHEPQNIPSVGISFSKDGGKTFPTTQIIGNGSVAYPDTTFKWVIDNEYVSEKFILVIWEYEGQCLSGSSACSSPYHDKSAQFAVRQ